MPLFHLRYNLSSSVMEGGKIQPPTAKIFVTLKCFCLRLASDNMAKLSSGLLDADLVWMPNLLSRKPKSSTYSMNNMTIFKNPLVWVIALTLHLTGTKWDFFSLRAVVTTKKHKMQSASICCSFSFFSSWVSAKIKIFYLPPQGNRLLLPPPQHYTHCLTK